jgi:hypothetical protein
MHMSNDRAKSTACAKPAGFVPFSTHCSLFSTHFPHASSRRRPGEPL